MLVIPGIGNSGPDHWQTVWEKSDPSITRFRAPNWNHPVCSSWVEAIDEQAGTHRRLAQSHPPRGQADTSVFIEGFKDQQETFVTGVPVSIHYRGGAARHGEGLFWEINGTHGDIRVSGASATCKWSSFLLWGYAEARRRYVR